MTQIAVAASDINQTVSGSDTGNSGWYIFPFSGATTFTEAIEASGGRAARLTFSGSGTVFAEMFFQLETLLAPEAGTHTITIRHDTKVDGDCELLNGDDNSTICIFGMEPVDLGSYTDQEYNLTAPEIAAIHDYDNIILRIYQAEDTGTITGDSYVDWVQFEIPNAAPPSLVSLRPDGDTTATSWATPPLWSKVEETSPDGTVITATAS